MAVLHASGPSETLDSAQAAAFAKTVLRNPVTGEVLARLAALGLPDCWLVAGCLFQAVWNHRQGRPPSDGVKDYDIFYCDAADISWDGEDRVIGSVRQALQSLGIALDVKNQARVHLWYEKRFASHCPQLRSSFDGIDRFLVAGSCIGMRCVAGGGVEIYAPFGLADAVDGVLRPNPVNAAEYEKFLAKAESYRARWPHLRIEHEVAPPAVRSRRAIVAAAL